MAGDWIKMRTALAAERATMVICDLTGLDEFAVVGRLHAIWVWAGEHTVTGEVTGVTLKTVDRVTRCEGFGEAMKAAGWLEVTPDCGLRFPRWKRHNSKASKERALAAARSARLRQKKRDANRDATVTRTVTNHAPREEERERREEKNKSVRSVRGRSAPNGRPDIDSSRPGEEPFDLSEIDWSQVSYLAEKAGKAIRPKDDDDRRAWLKYAVLAQTFFSTDWFVDAIGAVTNEPSRESRQARFVGALQKSAAAQGVDKDTFNSHARRVNIPDDVWKSTILR